MAALSDITLNASDIADFCRRHAVREFAIFGSAARGELRPESDLDVLVDFLPSARVDLLELSAMARELSAMCDRRVDLAVKPALKPSVRAEVLAEACTLYAA